MTSGRTERVSNTGNGSNYTIGPSSTAKPHSIVGSAGDTVSYVKANVDVKVVNKEGYQLLKINVTGDNSEGSTLTLSYDETVGRWYLKPGEAVRFGYDVRTNGAAATKDAALNSIAMPVYNRNEVELEVSDISMTSTRDGVKNDGGCAVLNTDDAHFIGMTGGTQNSEWLESHVTVRRDVFRPGISKRDAEIMTSAGTVTRESDGNVSYGETVKWETTVTNVGGASMIGYTVTDTMPAPFRFTGDVSIKLYDESKLNTGTAGGTDHANQPYIYSGARTPLFTFIRTDDEDGESVTVRVTSDSVTTTYTLENGVEQEVTTAKQNIHYGMAGWTTGTYKINVTWTRDDDGNETMALRMPDGLAIPYNGYLLLYYNTEEHTNDHENKSYVNQTWVTPVQEFDGEQVDQGNYVLLDDEPSVYDDEPVSVVSGYSTSANKTVMELCDPDNIAGTEMENKWILLKNDRSLFDYTLTVNSPASFVMSDFVLIDNLPEVDDHNTFAENVPPFQRL